MSRETAAWLPEHIRETLKRKSSRDPNSRFTTKLHLLLSYSEDCPQDQERVGCAWVTDEEFKMNKVVLSSVMGIKLNTMNVNLRDLHFEQIERDKDGWTRWKRSNFNKHSAGVDGDGDPSRKTIAETPYAAIQSRAPSLPFQLGHMTPLQREAFISESQQLWSQLLGCPPQAAVLMPVFIDRAAQQFRYNEQPLDNAKEVIEAIITPTSSDSKLTFGDLCRFLAMFGPAKTIMLKIASLLTCSNNSGKWLTFDFDRLVPHSPPYACFDENSPNCLVIHHADNSIDRVYNDPGQEANSGAAYLSDEREQYSDWADYFQRHPVKISPLSYDLYRYA